jgi:ribose/xylose/arabinose/galactoside ABC-type transport system permease subunit
VTDLALKLVSLIATLAWMYAVVALLTWLGRQPGFQRLKLPEGRRFGPVPFTWGALIGYLALFAVPWLAWLWLK